MWRLKLARHWLVVGLSDPFPGGLPQCAERPQLEAGGQIYSLDNDVLQGAANRSRACPVLVRRRQYMPLEGNNVGEGLLEESPRIKAAKIPVVSHADEPGV